MLMLKEAEKASFWYSILMTKLILMCGLPGSGKTTLARELAVKRQSVRLCTDDWQAALKVDHDNEEFHDLLEDQLWVLGQDLLKLGQTVIFEKGLWRRSERDEKRLEAQKQGANIELHYFDIPIEELVRRLEARNIEGRPDAAHVTKEQLQDYATRFFQPPDESELALFDKVVIHKHPE